MNENRQEGSYRFIIGGFTIWAHLAAGLSFQAVSPVLPLITDAYGINHVSAGLLVGVVTIIQGVFGVPAGIMAGRVGLKKMYLAGWLLMGLLALAALSPSFPELLALRMGYGLGVAMILPTTGTLIMHWFKGRELPIITSLNVVALSVGIVISVSTAAPLAEVLGWENVMALFAGPALAGGVAWLFWGRAGESAAGAAPVLSWGEVRAVLRNRAVLLLGLADAACFGMYIALSGWLPTFYHETRGMSLTQAGFITSLLPFTGIFAVLVGGFLPLKVESRRLFFIVPGALAGVGALGSFLIGNTALSYASVIVLGLGAWLYVPTLQTLPMELPGMTPQRVAIAWGWITTASGIGTFIAPLGVGAMRDATGSFVPGFLLFTGLGWFLFVAGFFLPETKRGGGLPGSTPPAPPTKE